MHKLTLTRLEDRIVYDAASIPVSEPTEPPVATEAGDGDADVQSPDTESSPDQPGEGDAAEPSVSPTPEWLENGMSDPLYLPHDSPDSPFAHDGDLAQPTDSPEFAAFLNRVAAVPDNPDEAESAEEAGEKKAAAGESATKTTDTVDAREGDSIFDQYKVYGDAAFNKYMLMWLDFVRGYFDGEDFIGHNAQFHDYLIGGRLGVEVGRFGQELNLYWLLDNGEKAFLRDCKFVQNGERLQLIAYQINQTTVFHGTVEGAPNESVHIPYLDVLNEFRFYSLPEDMGDTVKYFLHVNTNIDGNYVGSEGKYLSPAPDAEPPAPTPAEDPQKDIDPDGPIIEDGPDDNDRPRPGEQDQPDDPRSDDDTEHSDFDYGFMPNARIGDLVRLEELPENIRAEIEELSDLVGDIDDSEIPVARDIAASIAETGRAHARFDRGVSRLVGMLSGLDGLDKSPALAEWVSAMATRGERLFGDNSRHVSQLLRAVKEFRATEPALRDSMSHARIAGIGAAMDDINRDVRVIIAGLDRLSDTIVAGRGLATADDILTMLPDIEEHMAAIAKEMERLDAGRDTMFYVLRDAKATGGGPEGRIF